MSKTIEGVPEFLTREQYIEFFGALGFDPMQTLELRAAHDGVHALVLVLDEDGKRVFNPNAERYEKHRIFIPVRNEAADSRTTRVATVTN